MPTITANDADGSDDEDWYDDDAPDDDEPIDCPECGAEMHGYIDKCPKCGYWLTDSDRRELRPGVRRPAWQRATAAILIIGFLLLLILAGWTVF
jgi:hypothetical protein